MLYKMAMCVESRKLSISSHKYIFLSAGHTRSWESCL